MLNSKQIIFFGFLTICSSTTVLAMVGGDQKDVKTAGAQKRQVSEDSEFENFFIEQRVERRLHYAANKGYFLYVKKLCAACKEDGTLDTIMKSNVSFKTPVEWAIYSLNYYLSPQFQKFKTAYKDDKGKTIEPFDGFVLSIKTLIEFGAIVLDRNDNDVTKVLLAEIVAGIGVDGKIDRKKMGPVIDRIQELMSGLVLA